MKKILSMLAGVSLVSPAALSTMSFANVNQVKEDGYAFILSTEYQHAYIAAGEEDSNNVVSTTFQFTESVDLSGNNFDLMKMKSMIFDIADSRVDSDSNDASDGHLSPHISFSIETVLNNGGVFSHSTSVHSYYKGDGMIMNLSLSGAILKDTNELVVSAAFVATAYNSGNTDYNTAGKGTAYAYLNNVTFYE